MSANERTAAASPSRRTGDGGPAVLAVRRKARGNAGERLNSRFGLGAQLGELPFGKLAARERAGSARERPGVRCGCRGPRRRAGRGRAGTSVPARLAKRSTVSSSFPCGGWCSAVTRRVRLRVRSHAWRVRRGPRTSSAKLSVSGISSSPGSSRAGCRHDLRKASMAARFSSAEGIGSRIIAPRALSGVKCAIPSSRELRLPGMSNASVMTGMLLLTVLRGGAESGADNGLPKSSVSRAV